MTELMAPKVMQRMAARHRQLGLDRPCSTAGAHALERGVARRPPDDPRRTAHGLLDGIGHPRRPSARNHILGVLAHAVRAVPGGAAGQAADVRAVRGVGARGRQPAAGRGARPARPALLHRATDRRRAGPEWWSGLTAAGDPRGASPWSAPTSRRPSSTASPTGAAPARCRRSTLRQSTCCRASTSPGRLPRPAARSLDPAHANGVIPGGNGIFYPIVVIGGRVRGTWKRTIAKNRVEIVTTPFHRFTKREQRAIARRGRALRRVPRPARRRPAG